VHKATHTVPPVVIPVLVVLAIVGFLLGIHRSSAKAPAPVTAGPTRVASSSNVLVSYPLSWSQVPVTVTIPGLTVADARLIAPGGKPATAGLIVGQLPGTGSAPLPASFVSLFRGAPSAEVVSLANVQAYRYSGLKGYDRTLDMYVIPITGANPRALICYAANGASAYLPQCEQMVSNVALVGQTSYSLTPEASYASELATIVTTLDRERMKLRGEIHERATLSLVAPLASALADRLTDAGTKVATLEPPQSANTAQTALSSALQEAHDAYVALASAAESESGEAYEAAHRRVDAAEANIDKALGSFSLLGYSAAGGG
jgi:hypothetical protein